MLPGKKATNFTPVHTQALQSGFQEKGQNPHETDGKPINATIKSDQEIFAILQPFFSQADGGTKSNNNLIYGHYKTQACEYIIYLATRGIHLNRLCGECKPIGLCILHNNWF